MYQFVYWTAEHDEILTRMWAEGVRATDIGKVLKRTPNSVRNRAREINLPRRCGGRHAKNSDDSRGARFRKGARSVAIMQPKNGRFDSSRALSFLVDHWRAA